MANWSEPAPGETRSPALLLIPIVMLLTGVWVQYRFVRRAVLINLLDRTASPVAITALTVFGAVIAVALMNYWPSTPLSGPQTPWNRYRIGFEDFVALLVIWLAAIAGLLIGRRRQT